MDVNKIIDISFKDKHVEIQFLVNDGNMNGNINDFYFTRVINYSDWDKLSKKLLRTIETHNKKRDS